MPSKIVIIKAMNNLNKIEYPQNNDDEYKKNPNVDNKTPIFPSNDF